MSALPRTFDTPDTDRLSFLDGQRVQLDFGNKGYIDRMAGGWRVVKLDGIDSKARQTVATLRDAIDLMRDA